MIEVSRLYEGLRQEGISYGIPMTFVELGSGMEYKDEELLLELVKGARYHGEWVCILGKDTLRIGMGSLVKGLSKCLFHIECETDGKDKDPGWFQYVDRWIVDFTYASRFNYMALRPNDCIRFVIDNSMDLEKLGQAFSDLRTCQAAKYLKVVDMSSWSLHEVALKNLARQQERNRIYLSW